MQGDKAEFEPGGCKPGKFVYRYQILHPRIEAVLNLNLDVEPREFVSLTRAPWPGREDVLNLS